MGVDLTILPTRGNLCETNSACFSHNLLWLDRDRDLWESIHTLADQIGRPVPEGFASYLGKSESGDHCYGEMDCNDAYGEPLKAVRANDLGNMKEFRSEDRSDVNYAVGMYLRALPPDWVCVLYWH
jgi:hypothetical protein